MTWGNSPLYQNHNFFSLILFMGSILTPFLSDCYHQTLKVVIHRRMTLKRSHQRSLNLWGRDLKVPPTANCTKNNPVIVCEHGSLTVLLSTWLVSPPPGLVSQKVKGPCPAPPPVQGSASAASPVVCAQPWPF